MTRLLMNGPSKLIPKRGYLSGYISLPFAMLMVSILFCALAKASWVVFFFLAPTNNDYTGCAFWVAVTYLPQLILVSFNNQDIFSLNKYTIPITGYLSTLSFFYRLLDFCSTLVDSKDVFKLSPDGHHMF